MSALSKNSFALTTVLLFTIFLTSCGGAVNHSEPVPVITSATSPTPQPMGLDAYAESIQYISKETFATGVGNHWALENGNWENGEVHIRGNQSWGSYLVHLKESQPNYGTSARFRFENNAVFSIAMQHGEYGNSDYREIGMVFLGTAPQAGVTVGNTDIEMMPFKGSPELRPGTWYRVSFFVEASGIFIITVWQEDKITNNGYFLFDLDEASRNIGWRFAASSNSEILHLDRVDIFQFKSLHDPARVRLGGGETAQSTAAPSAPTAQPTPTPIPVSFSEAAESGKIEIVKRFGVGSFFDSEYSPDGSLIAYGTSFGVYLFDVDRTEIKTFIPSSQVHSVNFSPDGMWLAYGNLDGEITVWNIEQGEPSVILSEHEAYVDNVLFSPDQQFLLSSDENGRFNAFKVSDWTLQKRHELGFVSNMAFLPDGSKVIVGTYKRGVLALDSRGWGILNQYNLATFKDTKRPLSSLGISISPDGKYMAVGMRHVTAIPIIELSTGKTARLVQIDSNQTDGSVPRKPTGVDIHSVAFSPDGTKLAFYGSDRLGLADLENDGKVIQLSKASAISRIKISFSPKDEKICIASATIDFTTWDFQSPFYASPNITNDVLVSVNPHDGSKYFREEARLFANGKWELEKDQEKGSISLKESSASQPLFTSEAHTPMPFSAFGQTAYIAKIIAAAAPDESYFVTGGADKKLKLWQFSDAPNPVTLGTLKDGVDQILISPDSSLIAVSDANGGLYLFQPSNETSAIALGSSGKVKAIAFSPDGAKLAAKDVTGRVTMWNLLQSPPAVIFKVDQSRKLEGDSVYKEHLVFSPDGRVLVSGGRSSLIDIWSAEDGRSLQVLDHPEYISRIQFSEDGTTLYTDGGGIVRFWGMKQ